jgi:hypothetical protein
MIDPRRSIAAGAQSRDCCLARLHPLHTTRYTLHMHRIPQRPERSVRPAVTQQQRIWPASSSPPRPSAAGIRPSSPDAHRAWQHGSIARELPDWCRQTSPSQLLHVRCIIFFVSIAHESASTVVGRRPCFTATPNAGLATLVVRLSPIEYAVMAALQHADYRRSYLSVSRPAYVQACQQLSSSSDKAPVCPALPGPCPSCPGLPWPSGLFVVSLPKAWSKQRVRK